MVLAWLFCADSVAEAQATGVKIGAQLRAEALYQDHALEKEPGHPVKATTELEVQYANIVLAGNVAPDTDVAFGLDALHADTNPLAYGYFTHSFGALLGVSVGKMRVMQGGWDNASYDDYTAHATGVYANNLVYDANTPMAAITLKAAGTLTLQIMDDKVVGHDAVATWNKNPHPTWVLGWSGEFGPISPLLDVGSYDNNHSRWVDAGIKTDMNGLSATLDLYNKNQVNRYADPATGKGVGKADVASSITLSVAYELKGAATPWFYFSSFDDKQASDPAYGIEDHTFNTTKRPDGSFDYEAWDDNGQVVAFGVNIDAAAKGWTPYVAVVTRSGKFESQQHPGEPQEKSDLWTRVGVLGAF